MTATLLRKPSRLAAWRRESKIWNGINTFLLAIILIVLLLARCDGGKETATDVGLIVHTQLKQVLEHPTNGLNVRLEKIEGELKSLRESGLGKGDLAALEHAIAELKECACKKKGNPAKGTPRRQQVREEARLPPTPVVSVAPPASTPPPVVSRPPLDDIPRVTCPPREAFQTSTTARRLECK